MSRLEDIISKTEGETIAPKKRFKGYEPGLIHIDIKYLPQMPDETSRRYLFMAIDRATRWVFMHIYGDMTDKSSVGYLRRLKLAPPIEISKILTDNGSQFTDRFATTDKKPSGNHAFDQACAALTAGTISLRRGSQKRTAWSNASTAASTSCCSRLVLTAGPIWK